MGLVGNYNGAGGIASSAVRAHRAPIDDAPRSGREREGKEGRVVRRSAKEVERRGGDQWGEERLAGLELLGRW